MTPHPGTRRPFGLKRNLQWSWLIGVTVIALGGGVAAIAGPYCLVNAAVEQSGAATGAISASEYLDAVAAARTAILFAVGGAIALLTLYLTRLRDSTAERVRDDDRFIEAAKLLAGASSEGRMVGIHALRQLADDGGVAWQTIGEILSSFIRSKARTIGTNSNALDRPDVDLDHAFRAFAALTGKYGPVPRVWFRDRMLAYAPLSGANLTSANLHKADLTESYLDGADLTEANIEGAIFTGANLNGTVLTDVRGTLAPDQFDTIHTWNDNTKWPDDSFPQRAAVRARKAL